MQVLGLAVSELYEAPDLTDPAIKLKQFRAKFKLTYPLLSDEDMTVFNRFGGGGKPACVLIDRQGRFVARIDADLEETKKRIQELVAAQK